MRQLFGCERTAAVVIANGVKIDPGSQGRIGGRAPDAVRRTPLPGPVVIDNPLFYLTRAPPRLTVHGVYMEVLGMGVLLTGEAGIGKSELALELLSRGHRLIADDAVELIRVGPDVLVGQCPGGTRIISKCADSASSISG